MNKTEKLYKEILKEDVVNTKDLKQISKEILGNKENNYQYRKYLYKLLNEGKIRKIKRGLYYAIPLDHIDEEFEVDRYILSDKIKQGYCLGYHTALELYGASYSSFNSVFVLIEKKNRFKQFNFQNVEYKPVINKYSKDFLEKINYKNKKIMITNPARTFVECLDRLNLSGGWEECIKSLANLRKIELSDINEVLKIYKNKTLKLKTGYALEILSKKSPYFSHIDTNKLKTLKPSKRWKPVYIDRNVKSNLVKKWGLYVPKGSFQLLRGI